MAALGFELRTGVCGEKCYVLDRGALVHAELEDAASWLRETAATCCELAASRGASRSEPCAECVVQVRLPTGLSVQGGFSQRDDMQQLLSNDN